MNESPNENNLILSTHRALYEAIPPNVRGIICRYENGILIWKVFFDGSYTEDEKELLSCACTEVLSDFPDYIKRVEEQYIKLSYPQKMEMAPMSDWAFKRYENNNNNR
ncbi:hypothetical protein ACIQ4I_03505 [Rummeliibacillus sp. NPDC094406]|uniref:hypothetical protein n=1 Tax=Rummeliibacillus sp. NPDC094406 TaxID=3364511 RepID=UPI00382D7A53